MGNTIYTYYIDSVEVASFNSVGILSSVNLIKYDKNGNEIFNLSLDENKNQKNKTESKFDDSNSEIEMCVYYSDNTLWYKIISVNDKFGNTIESHNYNSEGKLKFSKYYGFKYDKMERVIEKIYFDSKDRTIKERYTYTYDEVGNIIEECSIDLNGITLERIVNRYNENRELIGKSIYNEFGNISEKENIVFEYDSVGNWIRKYVINELTSEGYVTLREIEYFN